MIPTRTLRAAAGDAGAVERFRRLRRHFAGRYAAVRDAVEPAYVRGDWAARNAALEEALVPVPPDDFLRHPAILHQMFVGSRYLGPELAYVRPRLPAPEILAEDPVGGPPTVDLDDPPVTTSPNLVHHVHHVLRYEEVTGGRLARSRTVVEWGGGYGSLARVVRRLRPGVTYVVLDTPLFAAVQWLYLSAVLGEGHVMLHARAGAPVVPHRVNVVPIGLAGRLDVAADVFVSTWALNESTPAAQRHVARRRWFGARGLLVAMHRGDPLEPQVLAAGARRVPVGPFMPAQHYYVR